MGDLLEMMVDMGDYKKENPMTEQDPRKLIDTSRIYLDNQGPFEPGNLVQWKPGMKNHKFPDYGQPMVVLEVMTGARMGGEVGTPMQFEPASIRIAIIDNDDEEFMAYGYDANRLMPYKQ